MPSKYFVEIGRIAVIHFGPQAGKTCAIVDVIDQNRALVDGPKTGVRRQPIQFKRLRLTKFRIRIPHGTTSKTVGKAWTKNEVSEKFAETKMAKRLKSVQLKANMTDFDRFKLYKVKQRMNRLINRKFLVLKSRAKRAKPKQPKTVKAPQTKPKAEPKPKAEAKPKPEKKK